MISKLCGKIEHVSDEMITLELNGIFYEILIPSGLAEPLRHHARGGEPVTLHTYYYIESSANAANMHPRLVGFTVPADREFFKVFTTVSGIGVRKALRCLTLPVRDLARAIEEKDIAVLKQLPGIGPRMAEKIVAELAGKTARFALSRNDRPLVAATKDVDFLDEVYDVLTQLQYRPAEIDTLIKKALKTNPDIKTTEEMVTTIFAQQSESTPA